MLMKFSIFLQFVYLAYWCIKQIYSILKHPDSKTKDIKLDDACIIYVLLLSWPLLAQ